MVAPDSWLEQAEQRLESVCQHAASPDALLREAFDELARAIPTRGGILYRYPGSGPHFAVLAGSLASVFDDVDPELLRPENDPSHRPVAQLTARPRIVPATRELDRREFERSPAYREVYAPNGVDHIVCAWLDGRRPGEPGMLGMMLSRDEGLGAFDQPHLALLRNVLPVLVLAAQRCDPCTPRAPWLRLTRDGSVLDVSPDAEQVLLDLDLDIGELLSRVFGEIRRWLDLRARRNSGLLSGTRIFHVVERRGRTLYVQTTERRTDVELRLLDSAVPLARLQSTYGLTPAEVAVLQTLAFGMSNADAADFLCVNIDTVKTHVRRVLRKLQLRSRLQAGLLMQRVLWDDAP